MKADYFLFGNNPSPSKVGDFTGCFKFFALKQLIRIVLYYWKKSTMYWNVLKACIYLLKVIPMNFMCINSDQTEKKAYKVCQNAKFGLSLHITQSMDDEL